MHLNYGHIWCKGCLNRHVFTSLESRGTWPPPCCQRHVIDIDAVRPSLEDHVIKRLDCIRAELECENPVYCHVPTCSELIPVPTSSDESGFIRCPKCHELTCVICKAAKDKHTKPRQCPELISEEDKELAKRKGYRQCPNERCQSLIERTGGCERITCKCGTDFCYNCGRQFDQTSDHASPCPCQYDPDVG